MNRTLRAIIAVVLIGIIMSSAIVITQNLGRSLRLDTTEQKLYTLSQGTRNIIANLGSPITLKLYYAKTAAMKAPDQIKFLNNYYSFVRELLDEYVEVSNGMIDLEVIDPRPYSLEEEEAIRYGLQRVPLTESENLFFGLVCQTGFGASKTIPFFSPDRHSFVEYDISRLIDNAMLRDKKVIGVLSPLGVMGEDQSSYMARMKQMQGQQLDGPWGLVEQLKKRFYVVPVSDETKNIKRDFIDLLMVFHPKDLPEHTLFAIDQYVMQGGRMIVFADPHAFVDPPDPRQIRQGETPSSSSDLNALLEQWGLVMAENTFVGDLELAVKAPIKEDEPPQTIVGFLNLDQPECFNEDSAISANLDSIRMLFPGSLEPVPAEQLDPEQEISLTPLLQTTGLGNSFTVEDPMKLMGEITEVNDLFTPGQGGSPPHMGYLMAGRFKTNFPDGVEVPRITHDPNTDEEITLYDHKDPELLQAAETNMIVVFSDVDFIHDQMAYQKTFFGLVPVGSNSAIVFNAVDNLSGSPELIAVRTKGGFRRPFTVVDEIEKAAEKATEKEEERIKAEIAQYEKQRDELMAGSEQENQQLRASEELEAKREIEVKLLNAQRRLRAVHLKKNEEIEALGTKLRNLNMLTAPLIILAIAVIMGLSRALRRRSYSRVVKE